jgi:hypothetical protein
MLDNPSSNKLRPGLIGGIAGGIVVAFVAGAMTAGALAGDVARGEPIVRANAWDEKPAQVITQVAFEGEFARCNPWEVSEVAMEEILVEMQRRGWRPPSQGDAVDLMDPLDMMEISALEPDAPMPRRYRGDSSIIVVGEETEEVASVEAPVAELATN